MESASFQQLEAFLEEKLTDSTTQLSTHSQVFAAVNACPLDKTNDKTWWIYKVQGQSFIFESTVFSGIKTKKKKCTDGDRSDHLTAVGQRLAIFGRNYDESYFPWIRYDDGDQEWVKPHEVSYVVLRYDPLTDQRPDNTPISRLKLGAKISMWWQGDAQFFDGTKGMHKSLTI